MNSAFRYPVFIFPLILSACSGPPEPKSVDWDSKPETLNSTLPEWKESDSINASANVTGKWLKTVKGFDTNKPFDIGIYYAIAHSTNIIVKTNSSQRWFETKSWLQRHGATGVITFEYTKEFITRDSVDVSFYRGFPVKPANPLYPVPAIKKEVIPPVAGSTEKLLAANVNKKPELIKDDKKPEPLKGFVTPVITPPLATAKTKNPFLVDTSPKLVTIPVKSKPVPVVIWRGDVGSTLKETVFRWAGTQSCATGGNWRVMWETPVNYSIDAPLVFNGDFKSALNGIFGLYLHANTPLYPITNTAQCWLKVTDKG